MSSTSSIISLHISPPGHFAGIFPPLKSREWYFKTRYHQAHKTPDYFTVSFTPLQLIISSSHHYSGSLIYIPTIVILLIVLSIIVYKLWKPSHPKQMDGQFNIAVAEFLELSNVSSSPKIGAIVSRMLFNFLEHEYQTNNFGLDIQVSHQDVGIIKDATEAEHIASLLYYQLLI